MKKIISFSALLLCSLSTISVKAQSQEDMQRWMDFMTPSAMHKMMASWDGEWNQELTMWMSPEAPPQTMQSSCVNTMIMGGRYQESKHQSNFGGMPFEGHSLLAWDNARKIFQSTWIDNMGTGLTFLEGPWDEASKTMKLSGTMTDPMSGKQMGIRQELKIVDDNTQELTQYSIKDGKETKSMFIKLTRKKK